MSDPANHLRRGYGGQETGHTTPSHVHVYEQSFKPIDPRDTARSAARHSARADARYAPRRTKRHFTVNVTRLDASAVKGHQRSSRRPSRTINARRDQKITARSSCANVSCTHRTQLSSFARRKEPIKMAFNLLGP